MEINAQGLEIGYGEFVAVENMDITVKKGEITTIIGPNGSGKSTVLKALTRLLKYRKGVVHLDEPGPCRPSSPRNWPAGSGCCPSAHSAPPDFKVKDLVGYGRMPYQKWYSRAGDEGQKGDRVGAQSHRHLGAAGQVDPRVLGRRVPSGSGSPPSSPSSRRSSSSTSRPPTSTSPHQLETMRLVRKLNRESGHRRRHGAARPQPGAGGERPDRRHQRTAANTAKAPPTRSSPAG